MSTNQRFLPEGYGFTESIAENREQRFEQLMSCIGTDTILSGIVKFTKEDCTFAIVDLGCGLEGWISSFRMSDTRKLSAVRSSLGNIINFQIVGFNEQTGTFTCDRRIAVNKAKQWQKDNYQYGNIIIAKVTAIIETGIFLDIGGGNTTFLCPKNISSYYINDLGKIFHVGQLINVQVIGYNPNFETFEVNYSNCSQFGLSIGTTISVVLDTKDHKNRWLCHFQNNNPNYQCAIIVNHIPNMVCEEGDIVPAKVTSFSHGVPLLKI